MVQQQERERNVGESPVDGQVGPERKERSNEQENHRQLHAGATTRPQGEDSSEDEEWDTDVAVGLCGVGPYGQAVARATASPMRLAAEVPGPRSSAGRCGTGSSLDLEPP